MQLRLLTWNSHDIQSSDYKAVVTDDGQFVNLSARPVFVPRAAQFPFLAGTSIPDHLFTFKIQLLGDYRTQREIIKAWFNILDQQEHALVAEDVLDSDKQWVLYGIPIRVVGEEKNLLVITLALRDPVWRSVDTEEEEWNITGSGQTKAVTFGGNLPAQPKFTITPTGARTGGYTYRLWKPVYLPDTATCSAYRYPLDLTDGGMDTAALTPAKMQADGDDLRVMVDGLQVDRWLADMDTDHTKVWSNLNLPMPVTALLRTDIADSGAVDTIDLTASAAVLRSLASASNKVLLIDDEAFNYTAINEATSQATGVTREQKDTAAAAHTAGDDVRLIPLDVWILYGNATATAPDVDDNNKPPFDLSASTNTSWVFTSFYSAVSPLPAAWAPGVVYTLGKLSGVYTGDQLALAEPATFLGLVMKAWQSGGYTRGETAELAWSFFHPCGITHVTYAGEVYGIASPTLRGLEKSLDGKTWVTVENETLDANSWDAFSHAATALGATYKYLRWVLKGSTASAVPTAAIQIEAPLTLTLDAAAVPVVGSTSETAFYYLNLTLSNGTVSFTASYPVLLNESVIVDCGQKTVKLADGTELFGAFSKSSVRDSWMDCGPGAVTFTATDTGMSAVTVDMEWEERNL